VTDSYSVAYEEACRYCREVQDGFLASLRDDLATFANGEELNDRLHEDIDGHEAVIYTGRSWVYLTGSGNDGAAEEELGDELKMGLPQRTYWAILADVRERSEWEEMCEAVESGSVAEYLVETSTANRS
jgi:hypothetical protein